MFRGDGFVHQRSLRHIFLQEPSHSQHIVHDSSLPLHFWGTMHTLTPRHLQERDALAAVVNQPQYMLARMRALAQASSSAGVSEKEREMLFKATSALGECVSVCERIVNTPIPLHYSRHTSRFLSLYVSTLPLALVASLGWSTIPAMASLCWALFGILEIGHLIEVIHRMGSEWEWRVPGRGVAVLHSRDGSPCVDGSR